MPGCPWARQPEFKCMNLNEMLVHLKNAKKICTIQNECFDKYSLIDYECEVKL